MSVDNIVPNQRSYNTPRNLDLTTSLCVDILITEHVSKVFRLGGQNVPSPCKPYFDGTVLFQRSGKPSSVDFVLAHITP